MALTITPKINVNSVNSYLESSTQENGVLAPYLSNERPRTMHLFRNELMRKDIDPVDKLPAVTFGASTQVRITNASCYLAVPATTATTFQLAWMANGVPSIIGTFTIPANARTVSMPSVNGQEMPGSAAVVLLIVTGSNGAYLNVTLEWVNVIL